MLKTAFKKHPLQNRTNVQIKGGGGKGLLNNVQKTALFSWDGFPKSTINRKYFFCKNKFPSVSIHQKPLEKQ